MHSAAFWRRAVLGSKVLGICVRLGRDGVGMDVLDVVNLRARLMAFTKYILSPLPYLYGLVFSAHQLSLIIRALADR